MRKDPMAAAYFNIHLITDTKMWRTDAFDLNAGHHQKMVMQTADTEQFLGVNADGKFIEQDELDHAVVWEFLRLPHNPLAFSLMHVESEKMLMTDPKTGDLALVERGSAAATKHALHQAFMIYMPANIGQAVATQNAPKQPWITKAMPYISAVGAVGGIATAAALVTNVLRSSQASHPAASTTTTPVTAGHMEAATPAEGGATTGHNLVDAAAMSDPHSADFQLDDVNDALNDVVLADGATLQDATEHATAATEHAAAAAAEQAATPMPDTLPEPVAAAPHTDEAHASPVDADLAQLGAALVDADVKASGDHVGAGADIGDILVSRI
ncbi:hypothetical protein AMAG_19397 [Allomyces macrogynus ATCC 38327]|uniref:Uncharacterized protein n=1 Tax=Allomyces macrogynus (strain ATCC 38327) TaxID=578462 RepID=A0A0L0SQW7_ALLM3|nr:hypothetical protein AMAG_19397 [Allomyces macrogynus ATCC 38327]|eukprot:KNE64897.1 hypothetical protein AMAG_19397 [Allomyces macrogynus ATCC 38327]